MLHIDYFVCLFEQVLHKQCKRFKMYRCAIFFLMRHLLFKNNMLIYLFWLCWVLVVACRISHCSCGIFSFGMWDLVPQPGIKPYPPALGAWSLCHWTTREGLVQVCFE